MSPVFNETFIFVFLYNLLYNSLPLWSNKFFANLGLANKIYKRVF